MNEHNIDSEPVWKMDAHEPFHRWRCSCGSSGKGMHVNAAAARKEGLEHAVAKSDIYYVGDMTISRTRYNHGWTVTREEGSLVLIGSRWERSDSRSSLDVMRYFAFLEEALEAAEADWTARKTAR